MYILTDQYDSGRIYHVVNPEDCPLNGGSDAIVCDEIEESPLGDACVCGLSVVVSRAKTIPRAWKRVQPGIQDTDARWDKKHAVFVRIFNDDNAWLY